jgi:hypothetical protein
MKTRDFKNKAPINKSPLKSQVSMQNKETTRKIAKEIDLYSLDDTGDEAER